MSIYKSPRLPYTYLIGWSKLGIFYYGKRTAKNCNPSDLWKSYFTSSKYVDIFVTENGEPDIITVRKIFNSLEDDESTRIEKCNQWEDKVLRRINAAKHQSFLNRKNGSANFDSSGFVTVRCIETNNILHVPCDEYENNREQYKFITEGTIWITNKDTLESYRITTEEFHKNRHMYHFHSEDKKLTKSEVERIRNLHLNVPKSETHKHNISVALTNYERTTEHQKNLTNALRSSDKFKAMRDPIIINGLRYDSISDAARQHNLSHSYLINMLAGRKKVRSEFWEFRRV